MTKEEEPLNALLLVCRPRLHKECPCVVEPARPDETPPALHVRETRLNAGLFGCRVGESSTRNHDNDRGQSTRKQVRQPSYCLSASSARVADSIGAYIFDRKPTEAAASD